MQVKDLANYLLLCFDGFSKAYGQHGNLKESETGKINGRASTIRKELDIDLVIKHLEGTGNSLGIIPLKENNKVKFGVIDIDIKHPTNPLINTIEEIEEKVRKLELPLIVCQSKSKGIHLYCFTQQEVDAKLMIKKLKEWSVMLGYGSCEIFPKQNHRVDENDVGNWINLPYFNYQQTERFAINKKERISIEKFFELVEVMRISTKELENFEIDNLDEKYNDAPPCLQTIISVGVEEGNRNNGLYNFAVYYKNKYPDSFEDKIVETNVNLFKPALKLSEVETIIKSVNKKDFFYKCNEMPICQFCNKEECKKRKFGIGYKFSNQLEFENLTKYISSDGSVRWYAEYFGQRIRLTTDELLNQRLLIKKMLDSTNTIFAPMKNNEWLQKLDYLLKNSIVYYDPVDASPKGQFKEMLDRFLANDIYCDDKQDLVDYDIYYDDKEQLIYFKSTALFLELKNKRFNYSESQIWEWLKELNAQATQIRINKKNIRLWFMPAPEYFEKIEDII